jgi:DNA mismatch repair protein MutS2
LEELLLRDVHVLATTHHGELKAFAHAREGAANASMEFDEQTLHPTYRVLRGVPGRSRAFEVARAAGIPEDVVARARELRGGEAARMEDVLAHLESERSRAREARERLESEERRAREAGEKARLMREKLKLERAEARGEFKRELRRALEAFRETLRGMTEGVASPKEKEAAVREAREEAQNLLSSLVPEESPAPEEEGENVPLVEGARVAVEGFPHAGGTLLRLLGGGEAEVEVAGKRLRLPARCLRPMQEKQTKRRESPPPMVSVADGGRAAAREINLIGKTVEEALPLLEKFLDEAARAGFSSVRVVHGRGTGKLRAAVRKALKEHPAVESFRDAEQNEGGSGATAVGMKG